jgi:hypothetical protein
MEGAEKEETHSRVSISTCDAIVRVPTEVYSRGPRALPESCCAAKIDFFARRWASKLKQG